MVEIPVSSSSMSPPAPPSTSAAALSSDLGLLRPWALVVRGLAAIAFGAFALFAPGVSLFALVIVWGAYAIADGVLAIALAFRRARARRPWGFFLLEGAVGVVVGIMTFAWPAMTAFVLVMLIGAWAVATGIMEIAAAIRLRRVMRGEWMLLVAGILSVLVGVYLVAFPGAGALAILWVLAWYAIAFGVLLTTLGIRVRRGQRGGIDDDIDVYRHAAHAAT